MRFRQHLLMSVFTVLSFIIVLFFQSYNFSFLLIFLFAVVLGAMMPDADADGTPALYHKAKPLYYALRWFVIKPVVLFFRVFIPTKHDVEELHRNIMHAPVGLFFSTLFVSVVLSAILYCAHLFSWTILLLFSSGILIGQLLHLLEDSLTPGGINWAFPWGDAKLAGNIYTHDLGKSAQRHDLRPFFFSTILLSINLLVFLLYYSFSFAKEISLTVILTTIATLVLLAWIFIFAIAKTKSDLWRLG